MATNISPTSHQRLLGNERHTARNEENRARDVLAAFMPRAWRRPLRPGELESKLVLFRKVRPQKTSFEEAIKVPLIAVLCSPHFLYLVEDEEFKPGAAAPEALSDFELASRLSYFLWSSMPDDELLQRATAGQLSEPAELLIQAERLLTDARSDALVRNFAGQWLRLRDVGANPPAQNLFPRYDDHLEVSMRGESEAFFAHVLHNDLNVMSFVQSDFVTINERLARFYDISGVRGDEFRVVSLPAGTPRGGLLTQASILSVTSNGTRTSPVSRGVWILENLLGDPPPPPPPNVGDIPPGVPGIGKATVRERLRIHREQPQCARCHDRIDPLGFALENYNAAGEWRIREATFNRLEIQSDDPLIDASAEMTDGTKIVGVAGLQQQLLRRQDQFVRCLAEKMFVYALGRRLTSSDDAMLDVTVAAMREQPTLRQLIRQIVATDAFRKR